MSTSKHYDLIAIVAMAVAVALAVVLYGIVSANGSVLTSSNGEKKYASTLFDTSKVHTIDLEVDGWDSFIANCEDEEYVVCNATIDGTTVQVVGLRAKGNTSLSNVSAMNSERYSFKIEFDHYNKGGNYDGLDKLSLNNCIQDTTYMKDYLTYRLMDEMGVDAPLCSYAYITVNGEDWGLYLAVEGIEESYLERTKGGEGELYKPESMNMGGGRGNGKGFNMEDFEAGQGDVDDGNSGRQAPDGAQGGGFSFGGQMPGGAQGGGVQSGQMPEGMDQLQGQMPPDGGFDGGSFDFGGQMPGGAQGGGGFGFGGMSGSGTNLKYTDDDLNSYSAIFDSSVTDTTIADRNRVVQALKTLSSGTNVESAVDVDQVIRYFAVHNYVVNSDSYTGSMVHNYYLYENDGQLSMIPWDYNLSFGTFTANDATSTVNDAIDSPLQASGNGSLPMFDFIVNNKAYLTLYHQYLQELTTAIDTSSMIEETRALIAPYVAKDATAFYGYDKFEQGVETLKSFCALRNQSIQAQLNGSIASTDSARTSDATLIDASSLNLSDMGSIGGSMGGGRGPSFGGNGGGQPSDRREPPGGGQPPNGNGGQPSGLGGQNPNSFFGGASPGGRRQR